MTVKENTLLPTAYQAFCCATGKQYSHQEEKKCSSCQHVELFSIASRTNPHKFQRHCVQGPFRMV